MSFTGAMKNYFGVRPGETIMNFAAELKALSYEEKMQFAADMRLAGIDCEDPAVPVAK